MNDELLKSFENVINFYKTKPKYLDLIGTEIYEKMYDLEKRIFEFGGCENVEDGCFEIHDRVICKCALCGNYFSDGENPDHDFYFAEQAIYCKPEEKTLNLMFPNEYERIRMSTFQDVHDLWNFCHDCSQKYGYVCHGGYWEYDDESKEQVAKCKKRKQGNDKPLSKSKFITLFELVEKSDSKSNSSEESEYEYEYCEEEKSDES